MFWWATHTEKLQDGNLPGSFYSKNTLFTCSGTTLSYWSDPLIPASFIGPTNSLAGFLLLMHLKKDLLFLLAVAQPLFWTVKLYLYIKFAGVYDPFHFLHLDSTSAFWSNIRISFFSLLYKTWLPFALSPFLVGSNLVSVHSIWFCMKYFM